LSVDGFRPTWHVVDVFENPSKSLRIALQDFVCRHEIFVEAREFDVDVLAQGVPAHIGTPTPGYGYECGDPYEAFLPPALRVESGVSEDDLRAVVFVVSTSRKGPSDTAHHLLPLAQPVAAGRVGTPRVPHAVTGNLAGSFL